MGKISELDMYLFGQGTHYDIYRKLGVRSRVQLFKKIQGMEEESSYTF